MNPDSSLFMKGTAQYRRSIEKPHPSEAIRPLISKRVASGRKAKFQQTTRAKLKTVCQLQLRTGNHLVNETREVREAQDLVRPPQQPGKARIGLFVPTATSKREKAMWIFTRHIRRTVEVTICIILERTARSLSTVTVRFGNPGCRRHGVIA